MSKRPLSNLSNNYKSQPTVSESSIITTNKLKRVIENESENSNSAKKSKTQNNDVDQENEKSSVLQKILSVNNRIFENITNSNLKASIYSSKKRNNKQQTSIIKSNSKETIKHLSDDTDTNNERLFLGIKDSDQELIEILNKKLHDQRQEQQKDDQQARVDFSQPINYYEPPEGLPADVSDYDLKNIGDINAEAQFAYDIFEYYFVKEKQFIISDYIVIPIVFDWIVELQDTLHLNHETIYLSVKIVDHYLSRAKCSKAMFQLLGSTAVLIASKFDSRLCPQINSFLYVCDNAYSKEEMIEMEKDVLSKIDFNLGIPLSYRFLRRYARCAGLSMEILTFARYILEMCLLEYEFVRELDSKMASSCLLLVFRSRKELNLKWTRTLEFYTHYQETDLLVLMNRINTFMHKPLKQSLQTIKEKYLTDTYFKVASIKLLPI